MRPALPPAHLAGVQAETVFREIRPAQQRCRYGKREQAGEMTELVRRVEEEGYVLLWCEVLRDLVAFHRDDVAPATIPAGFVPYSDDELRHLFGEDGDQPSPDALRLIHAAKKTGAIITNSRKEGSEPGNA